MSYKKFKSGDVAMIDQGNGTAHSFKVIELADGTYAYRYIGVVDMQAKNRESAEGKALQAVLSCVTDMEQDNGDGSPYSHGVRHMARTVRDIITDTLGGKQ